MCVVRTSTGITDTRCKLSAAGPCWPAAALLRIHRLWRAEQSRGIRSDVQRGSGSSDFVHLCHRSPPMGRSVAIICSRSDAFRLDWLTAANGRVIASFGNNPVSRRMRRFQMPCWQVSAYVGPAVASRWVVTALSRQRSARNQASV